MMRMIRSKIGRLSIASVLVLVLGLVASIPAMASGGGTLSRTPWQMYRPSSIVTNVQSPCPGGVHGASCLYDFAPAIPSATSSVWGAAPNPDTIDFHSYSRLYACLSNQADFSYFQTFVTIPSDFDLTQAQITFSDTDDGAEVVIFNSAYPNGIAQPGVKLGQTSTTNIAQYMVVGEVNRVVVIQVDDCPTGNNLGYAAVVLNGNTLNLDNTAPVAAPSQSPAANGAGWNNTDVTVSWNWTDAGSGIDAANCITSSTSTGEGDPITLTATCADNAGNVGTASYTVKVDQTSPTVTYSGNDGTYSVDQTVDITCSASDALSLVASDTCANVSGPAYGFALGTNNLSATATDNAGNVGSGSTSFTVNVTADGLCALTEQFETKHGVANSMCVKLEHGSIRAYVNEVAAQSGKSMTTGQADILTRLAEAL